MYNRTQNRAKEKNPKEKKEKNPNEKMMTSKVVANIIRSANTIELNYNILQDENRKLKIEIKELKKEMDEITKQKDEILTASHMYEYERLIDQSGTYHKSAWSKPRDQSGTWSKPRDGYICRICKQAGGKAESHWWQQCPNKKVRN